MGPWCGSEFRRVDDRCPIACTRRRYRLTAPIPDTPHETAGRQTQPGRRRLALGAALALVAGAAALFAATQPGPPPQAVETTTTTVAPPLVTTTTLGVELQGEP